MAPSVKAKPQGIGQKIKARLDGWVNLITGIGSLAHDKTEGAIFDVDILTWQECRDIWRGDDMAARIVETLPGDMLRQGFTLKIGGTFEKQSESLSKLMFSKMDDLQLKPSLKTAMNYQRAYGGGGIMIGADDGQDVAMPLNLNMIKTVRFLTVLEAEELQPVKYYDNALTDGQKYGNPSTYRIQAISSSGREVASYPEVHETRFVIFPGICVSKRQKRENNGWGDSVLVRCKRVLSQFNQTWGSAAILLSDFAAASFKMKGLAEFLSSNDTQAVVERAQALKLARSIARMNIMDSEESITRDTTPLTGLPEMLDKFALRLSASANMPVSLMLRQSPAGLNATGDSEIRLYYDDVKSEQDDELKPRLEYVLKILFCAADSPTGGVEPSTWGIAFNPLWQETQKEKAEVRKLMAEADEKNIINDVYTPEEAATSRYGGDGFSVDTHINLRARRMLTPPAPAAGAETDPVQTSIESSTAWALTPTDIASIVKVNQALEKLGLPPLTFSDGRPDPDGHLTVAEFQAKNKGVIAAAANATTGATSTPPALPANAP